MLRIFCWFFSLSSAQASLPPWRKVEVVEMPAHRCLLLEMTTEKEKGRLLCISEETTVEGDYTYFWEFRSPARSGDSNEKFEKRPILILRDTMKVCKGTQQSSSQFSGFETRDLDHDGRLDPVILVKAGKLKRSGLQDQICSSKPVSTALYEVAFRNGEKQLESHEPSYPVLQRLQMLEALGR